MSSVCSHLDHVFIFSSQETLTIGFVNGYDDMNSFIPTEEEYIMFSDLESWQLAFRICSRIRLEQARAYYSS